MGIPHGRCRKRGKEPGVKDAPDLILAAKIRPEPPVGPALGKDLVKNYVFLDACIIAHGNQPVTGLFQDEDMNVAEEEHVINPGMRYPPGSRFIFLWHGERP